MAEDSSARGSVWLVVGFLLGAAAGFGVGSFVGAAIGAIVGTVVATITVAGARARRTARALDGPVPDVRGLEPEKARAVLGIAMSAGALPDLQSAQERAASEVQAIAATDPARALTLAIELAERFPRSAIVHAELARRHAAVGDDERARASAGAAIRCALDGGSNPLAARLFIELKLERAALELSAPQWLRLAGALEAAGDGDAAAGCRAAASASG